MSPITAKSFSIHAGRADPWDPYLRRWEGGRDGTDIVYGILEVVSGSPEEIASIVWGVVDSAFNDPQMSITRVLSQALTDAHEQLSDYAARDWRAGATLVAMRGDELYVAWAGPSFVLFRTNEDGLVKPRVGDPSAQATDIALGAEGALTPKLVRNPARQAVSLLLAWTSLPEKTNEATLEVLLANDPEGSAPDLYRLVSDEREFAVLVARFAPAVE